MEEGREGSLERYKIDDSAVGFRKTVKSLENYLFVGDWITDISKAIDSSFDFLTVVINT